MAEKGAAKQLPWGRLDGKVVLVTGASSGLGREFCLDLAKTGCKVIAAARRVDLLNALCQQIQHLFSTTMTTTTTTSTIPTTSTFDRHCVAIELDVKGEGSAVEVCIQKAWDAFGRIDVLINNAGVRGNVLHALDLPEDEWKNTLNTNLTGSWLVTKHVCSRMRAAKLRGSVINISSAFATNRALPPGGVAYISSKAAMNTMTMAMALEFGTYGIRVNSICPGVFSSEITENLMRKEWLNKVVERIVPLRTLGSTDPALTSLVRYLIHDSSNYVSGNMFNVDSGASLPGILIASSL